MQSLFDLFQLEQAEFNLILQSLPVQRQTELSHIIELFRHYVLETMGGELEQQPCQKVETGLAEDQG